MKLKKTYLALGIIIIVIILGSAFYFLKGWLWISKSGYMINPRYCEADSDCVRQASCCDCGLGNYVNTFNYADINCGYVCECVSKPSRGVCINNLCEAVFDEAVCDVLEDQLERDYCFEMLAIESNDIDVCEKISDASIKEACLIYMRGLVEEI